MGPPMSHLLAGLCVWVALGWVEGSGPYLGPAEQEQNHYLAQLFGLYGENGTLTAGGLARLLHSLGLGRVQALRLGHHGPPAGRGAPPAGDNSTHRTQDPELSVNVWAGLPLDPSGWGDLAGTEAPGPPHGPGPSGLGLFHRLLLLDHSLADHLNEDCLNGSQLLVNFGLSPAAALTPRQFALLCPALLYQIDSRVCIRAPAPSPPGDLLSGVPAAPPDSSPRLCAALAQSALAVLLLSLPAPLSLLLLRLLGPRLLRPLLGFLGAVAVGTLCGDALLHLLPHAQGGQHAAAGGRPEEDLGPGLSVLGGLFLLFILENVLGLLRRRGRKPVSDTLLSSSCRDQSPSRELAAQAGRDAAGRKERTSELQAWTWRMAVGWPFSPCRQLQSQGLRAQEGRTASPQQSQPLLGTKATVTGAQVVVAPTSRGWSSWETVCTTSLTGWPSGLPSLTASPAVSAPPSRSSATSCLTNWVTSPCCSRPACPSGSCSC
ncbi:zinc transporter ZIP5 isoform X3 [Cervus canadensis]|uniref:zinc transporter ZIP5 isoform X3 n=1 Tax=Cervus canadensis TaxID=1574408 RepID=UPI001CA33F19|nr:zinc transporter ZIP5 isoform X3 [Cervus canadensis]